MKRLTIAAFAVALVLGASFAIAAEEHAASGAKPAAMKSVTGEVVDMGCYLAKGARGEGHIDCATKCLGQGMPMGILTSGGVLYLVTLDHENADPYNGLKAMAGKTVTVSGAMSTRNGMKGIEASKVALASK